MKTGLDLKSIAFGLILGLAVTFLLGANKQETGRFQFATSPGHAFVFDTQTGQVWEKYESDSGGTDMPDFNNSKLTPASR